MMTNIIGSLIIATIILGAEDLYNRYKASKRKYAYAYVRKMDEEENRLNRR